MFYMHEYRYEDESDAGFAFDCDENGNIDIDNMCDEAVKNLEACRAGEKDGKKLTDIGVQSYGKPDVLCSCGSKEPRYELVDARGIFCAYVCTQCEEAVKAKYRPDIFEDGDYWADEPIEEDY